MVAQIHLALKISEINLQQGTRISTKSFKVRAGARDILWVSQVKPNTGKEKEKKCECRLTRYYYKEVKKKKKKKKGQRKQCELALAIYGKS